MGQNKITTAAAQNFLGGGDFGQTLPSPDKASFVQWEGGPVQHTADFRQIFDVITEGDSGVTGSFLNPDATHGARSGFDSVSRQEREYRGAQFAYTARNTNFKCRLGFAFEDPDTCQSENHFGMCNGTLPSDPTFSFVGFHILDNYNGPAHETYHAIVVVGGALAFDVGTPVPVEILPYLSDPIAHNFEFHTQNGGKAILFKIDGKVVASYSGAAVIFAADMLFRHASLNGTTGHMVSQVEYMYLDNETI